MDQKSIETVRLAAIRRKNHGHDVAANARLCHYICPQFTETDIISSGFRLVIPQILHWRWIPTADESMSLIRFARPRGIDFPYLHSMIRDSFMSRANSIVIPGNKLDLAMQLILTPFVLQVVERGGERLT